MRLVSRSALALLVVAVAPPLSAQPIRTVALLGQTAPGFGDPLVTFRSFNVPVINQNGDVAFLATVGTNAQPALATAVYVGLDPGGLVLVARTGFQSLSNAEPTSVDLTFPLNDLRIDEDGRVAFPAQIDGSTNAFFFWDSGTLTLLARSGAPMKINGHNATTGAPISIVANLTLGFGFGEAAAFHAGKLIFRSTLQSGTYEGIWTADATHTCTDTTPADGANPVENNCVNLVNDIMDLPEAPPPPALPDLPRFDTFGGVARNPAGEMAAIVFFNNGVTPVGFYRFADDGARTFVERGNKPFIGNPSQLGLTTTGKLGFHGGYYTGGTPNDNNPSHVGFHAEGNSFRQVYQAFTTAAPGVAGAKLANPRGMALLDNQTVAGAVDLDKVGDPLDGKNAVYREVAAGTLALVAHEGQEVPAGAAPEGANPTFDRIYTAHVNRQGQVALFVKKAGTGITAANDTALYGIGGNGVFGPVLSEGELVELEDKSVRTVSMFVPLGGVTASDTLVSGPGTEGRASALNQAGDFALRMDFLDGSSGVFVIPLGEYVPPEPPKLVGLEVIQVIQDWQNSIALTEYKRTYVRAHLEAAQTAAVQPRLRGYRGGELGGSPLSPRNFNASVVTVPDAVAVRGTLEANPYFELPANWTNGTVTFELELDGVELECQEAAGPVPDDCATTVTFVPADELEVKIVKMTYFTKAQTAISATDAQAMSLARRLKAAYPVAFLAWNTGAAEWRAGVPSVDDWPCEVAAAMAWLRAWDLCTDAYGCKRLYYGLIPYDELGGCAAGNPSDAAASFLPTNPRAVGRLTIAHELGHALGRHHSVEESFGEWTRADGKKFRTGACCERANVSAPDYPVFEQFGKPNLDCSFGFTPQAGGLRPALGPMAAGEDAKVWGLDTELMELVDPARFFDMMSYCRDVPIHYWPSAHTYAAIRQAVDDRFSPAFAEPARGTATTQLGIRGTIDFGTDSAEVLPLGRIPGLGTQPPPAAGDYSVRLLNGVGSTLAEIAFEPTDWPALSESSSDRGSFLLFVDDDPAIREIQIERNAKVLGALVASANPPTVAVLSPNGGESLSSPTVAIQWNGDDPDGDPLSYVVQYSADGGTSWTTLITETPDESLTVARSELAKTTQGLIRVQASDGFDTATDVSDATFTVANNAPVVTIDAPRVNPVFSGAQLVGLEATALDREQGLLGSSAFSWASSLDGPLGVGSRLELAASGLASGRHWISATATDADGAAGAASIEIWVDVAGLFFADGFEADLGSWSNVVP